MYIYVLPTTTYICGGRDPGVVRLASSRQKLPTQGCQHSIDLGNHPRRSHPVKDILEPVPMLCPGCTSGCRAEGTLLCFTWTQKLGCSSEKAPQRNAQLWSMPVSLKDCEVAQQTNR